MSHKTHRHRCTAQVAVWHAYVNVCGNIHIMCVPVHIHTVHLHMCAYIWLIPLVGCAKVVCGLGMVLVHFSVSP